jgi:TetR/AcrR family transcriptional repressor of nem operon
MGRLKEFEDQEAIEKAKFLFWEKGYTNTNLKDLLKVMDIQNGSFYHSFGNKRDLFVKALEQYDADFTQKMEMLFNSKGSFKKKIRVLFEHAFDRQKKSECPKGCFLFNSVSSDVLEDREIQYLIRKSIENFENYLIKQINTAIENKELNKNIDSNKAASIIIAYIQGMMKLSVLDYSDTKFRDQTEYFLSALSL